MCVGLPGRVVGPSEKSDQLVRVDISGQEHEISVAILEEDVEVGDWLEIHMGHALAKLSDEEAQDRIAFMEELDAAHRRAFDELFEGQPDDEGDEGDGDDAGSV